MMDPAQPRWYEWPVVLPLAIGWLAAIAVCWWLGDSFRRLGDWIGGAND